MGAVHLTPGDYPSGNEGDVLTVAFTVMGIPCLGLNGGQASACGQTRLAAMMQMTRLDSAAIEAARRG